MSSLQPPPIPLLKVVDASVAAWLQDTWKKLATLQFQANTALYISGLKLSNATPDGNDISWSACTVYYQGAAYAIAAGHTTAGAMLVWWSVGDTTFSSGNSYTPGPTVFAIATNNQGAADTTWDKVGAASIQESQVLGGFTSGYAPQNPSDVSVLTGDSTTLLNVAFAGGIVSVGLTDSGGVTAAGGPITLTVTFDGSTTQTYTIKGPSGGGSTNTWSQEALNCAVDSVGTGTAAGDRLVIPFGVAFKTSCVVTCGHTGGLNTPIGATVNWAKKL